MGDSWIFRVWRNRLIVYGREASSRVGGKENPCVPRVVHFALTFAYNENLAEIFWATKRTTIVCLVAVMNEI